MYFVIVSDVIGPAFEELSDAARYANAMDRIARASVARVQWCYGVSPDAFWKAYP